MPAQRKNFDDAVALYEQGLSVGDISEIYGITRQAMYMNLKRRQVAFRNQLKFGQENHFCRGEHPYDDRVHCIVSKLIARGKLVSQDCEECGEPHQIVSGRSNIHAHHDDYNKPLDVRWLCYPCHYKWHSIHEPIRRTVDLPVMPREEICSLGGKAAQKLLRQQRGE